MADETFDNNDTDMTPQIIKLKNAGAESILNYALVRENTFVVKTKEKLSDDTPYVSAWGIAGPAFWKAAGDVRGRRADQHDRHDRRSAVAGAPGVHRRLQQAVQRRP